MKMKYKILDHTADIKIEIYGESLKILFENAHKAWLDIINDNKLKINNNELTITIKESSLEFLLLEYLKELNYYLTVKKTILINPKINISANNNVFEITSKVNVIEINSKNISIKEEIKAFTLHELNIINENNSCKATIIIDV